MKNRLAFSTNAFSNMKYSTEDAIHIIGRCGYSGVEILADKPHIWVNSFGQSKLLKLKETLEEQRLEVSNINANTASGFYGERTAPPGQNFGPSFSSTKEDFREWSIDPASWRIDYTKRCIDLALEVNATNVSVTSGFVQPCQNIDKRWEQTAECFRACSEYAGKSGIHLTIEYEPGMLIGSADDCLKMINDVNSPWLGVNFDIGHSFVTPGEDIFEAITKLKGRIKGIHVEDIAGPTPELHLDPGHLIPGDGVMPLREIYTALESQGYEGYYTVELYTYALPNRDPEYATLESYKRLIELFPLFNSVNS